MLSVGRDFLKVSSRKASRVVRFSILTVMGRLVRSKAAEKLALTYRSIIRAGRYGAGQLNGFLSTGVWFSFSFRPRVIFPHIVASKTCISFSACVCVISFVWNIGGTCWWALSWGIIEGEGMVRLKVAKEWEK